MMNTLNRKSKLKFSPLVLLIGLSISPFSFAKEPFSIAVSLGKSQTDVQQSHADITAVDDSDTSWSIELAYRLDKVSLTLGYIDLGEASVELNTDSYDPQTYHEQVKAVSPILAQGLTIGLDVPIYQYDKYVFKGQMGLLFWDNEIVSTINTGNKLTTNNHGKNAFLGASADYELSKNWMLGIQYRGYLLDESINDLAIKVNYQF